MPNIEQFHEWVETQSPMALREYTFAQASWLEQAKRITELEVANNTLIGMNDNIATKNVALEAKLAIAIDALEIYADGYTTPFYADIAVTKIKGE